MTAVATQKSPNKNHTATTTAMTAVSPLEPLMSTTVVLTGFGGYDQLCVEQRSTRIGLTAMTAVSPLEPLMSKTVVLTGFGGYDKLCVQQRLTRIHPGPDEVLLRVRASGVNFNDMYIRQGLHDQLPALPAVLGMEGSGEVVAVGHAVDKFKAGDRVFCVTNQGMWSEYTLVPAVHCFIMPDNMSYEEGAALPVNYITALNILFDFGNLRIGNSVLVHMAAGGVGMAATQLCKTVPDVTVYGTASSAKHETIQRNGVDHAIDYRNQDYVAEIRKSDPEGVDIVMDSLSGVDSVKGYNLLKPLGKIIHFGVMNAASGPTKSYLSMIKSYMAVKSYNSLEVISHNRAMCGYKFSDVAKHPTLIRSAVERLLALYRDGQIRPHIDSIWAYEDIGFAMSKLHDRANIGKIILSPDKEPQQRRK